MTNRELAKFAKREGYEYIATIVKMHFNSNYYNINKVDDIIQTGKFTPAPIYNGFAHGILRKYWPDKTVERTLLRYDYNKRSKK